ncbi:hypothetical protein BGX34_007237 [Mortierella sp. NVP85]|nr:hypothetical protein BGX34_007237 [Mortierella sp. NVP85]
MFAALGGPGEFYDSLTDGFNNAFQGGLEVSQLRSKVFHMKKVWKNTDRMAKLPHNRRLPPTTLQHRIRNDCHFYFIMEPIWGKMRGNSREVGRLRRSSYAISDEEDDQDNDEEQEEEEEEEDRQERRDEGEDEGEEDIYLDRARLRVEGRRVIDVSAERALERPVDKGKGKATTSQTPPDDTDVLGMLKDLRQTSMLQCEAEKEQTRREQMRYEERARAQQETAKLEQLRTDEARLRVEESRIREEEATKREQMRVEESRLRVEEARLHAGEARMREEETTKREQLRVEEIRMREEEATKREGIRAEVEKMKEQVRMKELELEHTNKLLLLEETRLKLAVAEMEHYEASKMMKGDADVAEHRLEASQ